MVAIARMIRVAAKKVDGFAMAHAFAPTTFPPRSRSQAAARGYSRIAVFDAPEQALADWATLEAIAPVSVYQTRRWLLAWMRTIGTERRIKPMLVVAYDSFGQPLMLLPLGLECSRSLRIARYLGGKDANFNMPLCRPDVVLSRSDISILLQEAAHLSSLRPDVFILSSQAESWEGIANPLATLPRQPSPSFGFRTALGNDGAAFLKSRLSADARKKLNAKFRKLQALGEVALLTPRHQMDVTRIIMAFQVQKAARFKMLGIQDVFETQAEVDFLIEASMPAVETGERAIEWYALSCGGKIVATFAGGLHRGRLHGMVTSFDMTPETAASSPGDLLMQRLFAECCERGIRVLDLGVGEARYKSTYCDSTEPLFDTLVAVSPQGRLFAAGEALRLALKRRIKQSAFAWWIVLRLRRLRGA